MLKQLFVKNFALVEDLKMDFSANFNVLTGETGAGKSIVIDALSLLLGGRARQEFIRTGTKKAVLEAVFVLPEKHPLWKYLAEIGIEEEAPLLVLNRELSLSGPNLCRINGRVFTLKQYQKVGLAIVDLHGQHEHQSLLCAERHLELLDKFGNETFQELKEKVREKYEQYWSLKTELEELQAREQEYLQKRSFLEFQLREIKQANPQLDELEELAQEVKLLSNAEKINEHLQMAYQQLFSGENSAAAYDLLSKAFDNLRDLRSYDLLLKNLAAQLEPIIYLIEEIAAEIRNFLEGVAFSPERLTIAEERLFLLKDLCKKYGPTMNDVLNFAVRIEKELTETDQSIEKIKKLKPLVDQAQNEYLQLAQTLTNERKKIAKKLEAVITEELIELAMPDVRFAVSFSPGKLSRQGLDQVEFLISPNPGEPLLPVAKIASGGELSRIMLALKTIMASKDDIITLVFDEIDAGIGGQAVQKVADRLARISQNQQVICVTHSPLLAAIADQHFLLKKEVKEGRTRTVILKLDAKARKEELARMFGGKDTSQELKKYVNLILKK